MISVIMISVKKLEKNEMESFGGTRKNDEGADSRPAWCKRFDRKKSSSSKVWPLKQLLEA